jgi:hypothetical protein
MSLNVLNYESKLAIRTARLQQTTGKAHPTWHSLDTLQQATGKTHPTWHSLDTLPPTNCACARGHNHSAPAYLLSRDIRDMK